MRERGPWAQFIAPLHFDSREENPMALSSGKDAQPFQAKDSNVLADFPASGRFESPEQIRRFELLRLAFFALKLRKLEHYAANETGGQGKSQREVAFRCN